MLAIKSGLEMNDLSLKIDSLSIDVYEDSPTSLSFSETSSPMSLRSVTNQTSLDHYKSTFIYVISNQVYADKNMYKIGKHTGSRKGLLRRYKTYLIDPIIYLLFPTGSSTQDETNILSRLSNYRMGTSEFVQLDLDRVTECIEKYFRTKYKRNPCVKLGYTKGLVCENVILDLETKILQNSKCMFFPNFNFSRRDDCLESVAIWWEQKQIFHMNVRSVHDLFSKIQEDQMNCLIEFMRSFFIRFEKQNSYLYLNQFEKNGWSEFLKYSMEVLFSYHQTVTVTRKEFLKKESFHERVIFVRQDDTPLDLVLTKAQQVEVCLVMEDQNVYSVNDIEMDANSFENLVYYFFYVF